MTETKNDDPLKDLDVELEKEQRSIEEVLRASRAQSAKQYLEPLVKALKKGTRVALV